VTAPIPTPPTTQDGPGADRPSLTAPALGLVGATTALLTGGWLMYAPFVLGYQPAGAEWADATVSDFWTGLGLAVLALVVLGVLAATLVGGLRAHGALAARPRPAAAAPEAPPAPAPADDLTALLRPLVEALGRDTAATPLVAANGATPNHRVADPADH
jgi:hypothetical protein